MKNKISRFLVVPFVLMLMGVCMNMTSSINASEFQTKSSSNKDYLSFAVNDESFTWTELGKSVTCGAVGGAVGGAVAGAAACGVGAGPGALTGAVGGAIAGAAVNAVEQAWDAVFGSSATTVNSFAYSEAALD